MPATWGSRPGGMSKRSWGMLLGLSPWSREAVLDVPGARNGGLSRDGLSHPESFEMPHYSSDSRRGGFFVVDLVSTVQTIEAWVICLVSEL